jgi:Glyoxalase-like domain
MTSVKQFQVTFDCAEPERVARFWCEVLGYVVPPPPEGFATWDDFNRTQPPEEQGSRFACTDPSGVGPRLIEFIRGAWTAERMTLTLAA